MARSLVGTLVRAAGLSLKVPRRKRDTRVSLPNDIPPTQRNVLSTYGRHINLQSGRGYPCSEPILQELQHCTDWAVNWKVKTFHFKAYIFLVEGALKWRMVSTTSVERPESMSWAPSEAKPTVSTVLVGGEISSPLLGTEDPS